ncbi:rhodanese-like domain-containing protein [Desulfobacterales bacterium HSG16]|nr:rhodanese-like domain-containing protein [Desulfobacterales bacterium HSG16]
MKNKLSSGICVQIWSKIIFILVILLNANMIECKSAQAADFALISVEHLQKNMSQWTILDARPKAEFQAAHLPGAFCFSWEDFTKTDKIGVAHRILPPEKLAAALGNMGMDRKTSVVVYGDADTSWGGEGWVSWVLTWLGHKGQIRVLDGGIQAWTEKQFVLVTGNADSAIFPKLYNFSIDNSINITSADIKKNRTDLQLVDTRSFLERIKGRISGAVYISWKSFYKGKKRHPRSSSEIVKLLEKKGIDLQKPVVYYCTGGIRSAYAWMVHKLALPELSVVINYEGGMEEWSRADDF